jgi:hypothetical protein
MCQKRKVFEIKRNKFAYFIEIAFLDLFHFKKDKTIMTSLSLRRQFTKNPDLFCFNINSKIKRSGF